MLFAALRLRKKMDQVACIFRMVASKIELLEVGERGASRVTDQEMNEHKAFRSFGIKPKLGHG